MEANFNFTKKMVQHFHVHENVFIEGKFPQSKCEAFAKRNNFHMQIATRSEKVSSGLE